jgi:hypothetical protein
VSVIAKVRAVPRGVVDAGLGIARLPVSAVARVSRQTDNEQWAPTLAFEGFEAGVETVVGSLLRDETLTARGRVRQAKVAQLRKAAQLETVSDQVRHKADEKLDVRREKAGKQRQQAERKATQREQEIAREEAARERQAAQQEAAKTAAAAKAEQAQREAVEKAARDAKAAALAKEAQALDAQKAALEADKTVDALDESIDASKAVRKTS